MFTGVGKTVAELEQAIDLGVKTINAESDGELERIDAIARARQTRHARRAARQPGHRRAQPSAHLDRPEEQQVRHRASATSAKLPRRAVARQGLELVGLHSHVGSQITDLAPLRRAAEALVTLSRELRDDGIAIEHLDLGGGLGISYDGSPAPTAQDYAAALLPAVKETGLSIILEPGRSIVGPAGVLLASVVDVKDAAGRQDRSSSWTRG